MKNKLIKNIAFNGMIPRWFLRNRSPNPNPKLRECDNACVWPEGDVYSYYKESENGVVVAFVI